MSGKAELNYCKLCLLEKQFLKKSFGEVRVLNEKLECVSKCCHYNKYFIKNLDRNNIRN